MLRSIPPARLELLVWVLIYSGLLVLSIGYALRQRGVPWGVYVMAFGVCGAVAGAALVWVRSKMGDARDLSGTDRSTS